jgi:murein DD-endopeptidase MepM/ murein hydrolase activator NlpD
MLPHRSSSLRELVAGATRDRWSSRAVLALAAALIAVCAGSPASALPPPLELRGRSAPPPAPGEWSGLELAPPAARPEVIAASPVPADVALGSHYGFRRGRTTGRRTFHAGLDFPTPAGTRVFAARAGTVARVVRDEDRTPGFRGYGNAVVLHHPSDDRWTFYAHLSEVRVLEGQRVAAGQALGAVGHSSNGRFRGMGDHLHFEVRHRRPEGRAPFPGPYRWNNLDPARWLEAYGLRYGEHGLAITDGERVVGGGGLPVVVRAIHPAPSGLRASLH